jgi:TonB family protein
MVRNVLLTLLLCFSVSSLASEEAGAKRTAHRHIICNPQLKFRKMVMPEFPAEAEKRGLRGTVVIQALIDKTGAPQKISIVRGDPILAKAALKAVQQSRWQPYLINGEAVEIEMTIGWNFEPR